MLRANVSLHNAELKSYRLEVLAGEQLQVDYKLTCMKKYKKTLLKIREKTGELYGKIQDTIYEIVIILIFSGGSGLESLIPQNEYMPE